MNETEAICASGHNYVAEGCETCRPLASDVDPPWCPICDSYCCDHLVDEEDEDETPGPTDEELYEADRYRAEVIDASGPVCEVCGEVDCDGCYVDEDGDFDLLDGAK